MEMKVTTSFSPKARPRIGPKIVTYDRSLEHWGDPIGSEGQIHVIDCKECGFAHLVPLPSAEYLETLYEGGEFYSKFTPSDRSALTRWEFEKGLWDPFFSHHSSWFPRGSAVMDVGCGFGHFLEYRLKRGLPTFGIEPSPTAPAPEASPFVFLSWEEMDELSFWKGSFSIRLNLVLEHILHPALFLRECNARMGPKDRLLVQVPNEFNPLQRRAGGHWFFSQAHVNYFTPGSLRALLKREGFREIGFGASFPMEIFLLLGYDYRGNEARGQRAHSVRLLFEFTLRGLAFRIYRSLFQRWGWGREFYIVCEAEQK
jgi:SAM-dependent methyltransferase